MRRTYPTSGSSDRRLTDADNRLPLLAPLRAADPISVGVRMMNAGTPARRPRQCELYAPKKKSISSSQLLHGRGSSKGSGNGAPGTTA